MEFWSLRYNLIMGKEVEGRGGRPRLDTRFIDSPLAVEIRLALEESGLTQQEIAKKAGFSQPTVSRAVGGRVSDKTTELILQALRAICGKIKV